MKVEKKYFIIFIILLLSVSYVWFLFEAQPVFYRFQKMNREEKNLREQIQAEKNLLGNQSQQKAKWQKLKSQMARYIRTDGEFVVGSEIFSTVLQAGELSGIVIEDLQPEHAEGIEGVSSIGLALTARGRFIQFVELLDLLTKNALPIVLTNFHLKVAEDGILIISAQFSYHFFSAMQKEIPLVTPSTFSVSQAVRDPFIVDSNVDLKTISFMQIKFVGYLQEGKNFLALAKLPNGRTMDVRCGEKIGLEQAIVIEINEKAIMLSVGQKKVKLLYSA